jgi:hypothetical protein
VSASAALSVELAVSPEELTDTDSSLEIRVAVRNEGDGTVDSGIRGSKLLVDGTPSVSWSLAISNGTGDVRERELPPGESIEARRMMNGALLGGPGRHELVLEIGDARSSPATVKLNER